MAMSSNSRGEITRATATSSKMFFSLPVYSLFRSMFSPFLVGAVQCTHARMHTHTKCKEQCNARARAHTHTHTHTHARAHWQGKHTWLLCAFPSLGCTLIMCSVVASVWTSSLSSCMRYPSNVNVVYYTIFSSFIFLSCTTRFSVDTRLSFVYVVMPVVWVWTSSALCTCNACFRVDT